MSQAAKTQFPSKFELLVLGVGIFASTTTMLLVLFNPIPKDESAQGPPDSESTRSGSSGQSRPKQSSATATTNNVEWPSELRYSVIPPAQTEFITETEQADLIEAVEKATAEHPQNARFHYLAGITFGELLKTKPASDNLRRALELQENDIESLLALADILIESGEFDEAIKWLEKAAQNGGMDRGVAISLGDAHSQAGNVDRALEVLQSASEQYSDDGELLGKLAQVQNQTGDFVSAEKNARRAMELEIKDRATYLALSTALMRQRKVEEARALRESMPPVEQQIMPDDTQYQESFRKFATSTYSMLGTAYMDLDDATRAEEYFRRALSILPTYAPAAMALGNVCRSQGRLREAMQIYDHLTRIQPENVLNYSNLASLAVANNNVQLAESALRRAVEVDSSGQADMLLARFLVGVNKLQDAAVHAERAAKVLASPDAFLTLVSVYQMSGDQSAAMYAFSRGKSMFPADSRFESYPP